MREEEGGGGRAGRERCMRRAYRSARFSESNIVVGVLKRTEVPVVYDSRWTGEGRVQRANVTKGGAGMGSNGIHVSVRPSTWH